MEATESQERRRRQEEDEPDPPKDEGTRSMGDTLVTVGRKKDSSERFDAHSSDACSAICGTRALYN